MSEAYLKVTTVSARQSRGIMPHFQAMSCRETMCPWYRLSLWHEKR